MDKGKILLLLLCLALASVVCSAYPKAGENKSLIIYGGCEDRIDAHADSLQGSISLPVTIAKGREAVLTLTGDDGRVYPSMKIGTLTHDFYEVYEGKGFAEGSILAMDLNHDGRKEILVYSGEHFVLFIYVVNADSTLSYAGMAWTNNGFYVTSEGMMVCLLGGLGGRGGSALYKLEGGELECVDTDYILTKIMYESPGFLELKYDYEPTPERNHDYPAIYEADEYMICHSDSVWTPHVFRSDLDGDGEVETFYIGNASWDQVSRDNICLLRGRSMTNLIMPAYIHQDKIALQKKSFDIRIKHLAQLSVKDLDGDGVKEIIVSFSDGKKVSNYVFEYKGGAKCDLRDSFVTDDLSAPKSWFGGFVAFLKRLFVK